MKNFLKYFLASFLAIIAASMLLFFITLGIVAGIVSRQGKAPAVKEGTTLRLKLNHPVADRKTSMPALSMDLSSLGLGRQTGLNELLKTIDKAGRDSNIAGIYLELTELQTGIATIEEIRNALLKFRETGKFIVAFSDTYTQGAYYLASAADRIYLNPAGYINFTGMSAEVIFYKQTLEKLDIQPEIIRHGEFKSAVEPFMYDKMSPENREQVSVYLNSIWAHIVSQISESRNIPVQELNEYADRLMMWSNVNVEKQKLVDASLYKDQVMDTLNCLASSCGEEDVRIIDYDDYLLVPDPDKKQYSKNKIAVIYASGDIVMGNQSDGMIGSDGISAAIRKARKDKDVKAIVLRVNSGGGSALASEVIWREVDLAGKVKPVIASLGDVAASGGYYIVAPADTIVASPVSITGSIGVFALTVNMEDFMEDKLGVNVDVERTNRYSDFGSVFRPLSADERQVMQNYVDGIYTTFVGHVAEGRDMPYPGVDRIAEGRVWSGENATELGLVDLYGGLEKAIEIAAEKSGIDEYRIIELPEPQDPLTLILDELTGSVKEKMLGRQLRGEYARLSEISKVLGNDRVQTRIPFTIKVF